ncbi:MAG: hypothetical protein ACP5QO_14415 [Clostridia bacterium]
MSDPRAHITEAVKPSSPDGPSTVWPIVSYPDRQAAIDFLVTTVGFEPMLLVRDGAGEDYAEVELRWPHGSDGSIIGCSINPEPH